MPSVAKPAKPKQQYFPKLGNLPAHWKAIPFREAFDEVKVPVEVEPNTAYREIGIRSHGKGLFYKEEVLGSRLGDKSVYWVQPDCLVANIVFAWEQGIARTTDAEVGMIASHRFPMFRPKEDFVDLDFALYFFKTGRGRLLLDDASPGGAGRNKTLSRTELYRSHIPLPPLPEQQRIARILGTWDKAICLLQEQITAKELRLRGLIDQLVSGQRHGATNGQLPKGWKWVRLGEVFEFLSTTSHSRSQLTMNDDEGDVLYIHYGDIHATYATPILDVQSNKVPRLMRGITIPRSADFLKDGDLIIADASEDIEGVGACVELSNLGERRAISGLHTLALRDKSGHTALGYRAYLLRSDRAVKRLREVATGSKVHGVSRSSMAALKVPLPPKEEQDQIARCMNQAHGELDNLSTQLEQLQLQKKGLMQGLLSGRYLNAN